jgi:hypothetical protein
MRPVLLALGMIVAFSTLLHASDTAVVLKQPPLQRGAALGLFSENPDWSYVDMIDEMKAAGVSHVAIVVPYYMKTNRAVEIYQHPRHSMPMHTVERTIADIRARGMDIFLFPILRMEDNGWRGALDPVDVDLFYRNYTAHIIMWAKLAEKLAIPIMSIGSELSSMDVHTDRWRALIAQVRKVYRGKLTYSANWDHYFNVNFFDALDYAGVTGYFELQDKNADVTVRPSTEELVHSWREVYVKLMRWQHRVKKPIIFTETGYLSQQGAAARPWDEGAQRPIDLELQRRLYASFARVWDGEPRLAGNYFWNWFGWGGHDSNEYTPRNKPAAREVMRWYGAAGAGGAPDSDAGGR